jgi:F-type H+-transporting ATPase subunit alpha
MRHPETLAALKAGKLDDQITGVLETVAKELAGKY